MRKTNFLISASFVLFCAILLFAALALNKQTNISKLSSAVSSSVGYSVRTLADEDIARASSTIAQLAASTTYSRVPGWNLPSSSEPGVPIVIHHSSDASSIFYLYNFLRSPSSAIKIVGRNSAYADADAGNGGQGGPLESTNLLYTAYSDRNNTLYILSNGTLQKSLVYHGKKNNLVTPLAWSPDSKKLLFLTSLYKGEGEAGSEYSREYYKIFNTDDGSLVTIPASIEFSLGNFLDNDHIVVKLWDIKEDIVTAVELGTLKLDHNAYQQKFGFADAVTHSENGYADERGGFAQNGEKFAYSIGIAGSNEYEHSAPGMAPGASIDTIMYGDSRMKTAAVLAKGAWAQYQNILISPQGDKVVYEEEKHDNSFPRWFLWLYDSATGNQRPYKYAYQTRLVRWLNNDKFLVELMNAPTSSDTYGVFDVTAGSMTDIFEKGRLVAPLN